MDTTPQQPISEDKSQLVWWVVGVIVALVLAAFLVYYLRTLPEDVNLGGVIPRLSGDTVSSLEAEANAVDLNNLDKELEDIDKELAQ